MIRIAGSVSKSWLASYLDVTFDHDYYFDPEKRFQVDHLCDAYTRRQLADLGAFYTESNLGRIEYTESNQVLIGGIQPNMIVGMLVGAEFLPVDDADADISATCLAHVNPAELPAPVSLLDHPLVRQLDEQIQDILGDPASSRQPIPPFFWDGSGRAAVHGAITSGMKFYGDTFLLDMVVDPERCGRIIDWLTEVSVVLVDHFAERGRVKLQGIHVGECVSCMVDRDNFRRFVVPAASELGRRFPPLRFHSCGRSDHVIEACAEIEGLGALDVGGETSVAEIRRVFGRAFPIGIAPLVEHMSAKSPASILQWFDRIHKENNDGDLTIGYHFEADYNIDTIRALHRAVDEIP